MIIDKYVPRWDIGKENKISFPHSRLPNVSVIHGIDFGSSHIIKSLFLLRGLPSSEITIKRFIDIGFSLIAEDDSELVIGLIAQPWKLTGNLKRVSSAEFIEFRQADFVKIGWNFTFSKDELVTVKTTTRILSTSNGARMKFGMYWLVIGVFSGLIRKEMLRIIKNQLMKEDSLCISHS
jgi:hypothetical protein